MVNNLNGSGFSRPNMAMGFSRPSAAPAPASKAAAPSKDTSEEKFTFFWQGPLSQWHISKFVIDGHEYKCGEQWMMAEKARLFNDQEIMQEILDPFHAPKYPGGPRTPKTPKDFKALGRKVRNFDEKVWNQHDIAIVKRGNHAKFTQNMACLKVLLAGEGTTFVEASPYDTIWGIGLAATDPRAKVRSQWKGANKLGFILTELSQELAITHKHILEAWEKDQLAEEILDINLRY